MLNADCTPQTHKVFGKRSQPANQLSALERVRVYMCSQCSRFHCSLSLHCAALRSTADTGAHHTLVLRNGLLFLFILSPLCRLRFDRSVRINAFILSKLHALALDFSIDLYQIDAANIRQCSRASAVVYASYESVCVCIAYSICILCG